MGMGKSSTLTRGYSVTAVMRTLGSPTGSSLQRAAGAGNRELVELLLAHSINPDSSVDSGGNATFAAKTPEIRALLTARGGKIDPADLMSRCWACCSIAV